MPELPTDNSSTVTVVEEKDTRHGCRCEFCECQLSHKGEVLRRGAAATRYLEMDRKIEQIQNELAAVKKDRDELAAKLDQVAPRKDGGSWRLLGQDD